MESTSSYSVLMMIKRLKKEANSILPWRASLASDAIAMIHDLSNQNAELQAEIERLKKTNNPINKDNNPKPHCSFCGKEPDNVKIMISGKSGSICNACFDFYLDSLFGDD